MEVKNLTSNNVSSSCKSSSAINNQMHKIAFAYSEVIPYTSHVRIEKNGENKNISSNYLSAPTVKDYIIVWLDSNIDKSNEVHQNVMINLRQVINSINTFTDVNECINFVTALKTKKIFMIVSYDLGQQIVHQIQNIPQLESIYVFCNDSFNHESWTQQCNKVKGVFTQIKYICELLNTEMRRYDNYRSTISSLSFTDGPILGLNELDQSFMYSQLLKEILLEMEDDDRKKEMGGLVAFLRDQYVGDNFGLRSIDEFERDYNSDWAIKWYTKERFIYSTLNQALRTQDINIIIKMGFFIRDLHRQIEQLHRKSVNSVPTTVYRGQAMSSTDFEKMRNSKGGLLSFNNFLSTSADRAVSSTLAESNKEQAHMIGIDFEIEIDPSISYASFAALGNVSHFDLEEEILFSMNTVFRIGDMEEIEDRLWNVKLTLTSNSDEQLKHVTDSLRKEIGEGTGWHRLGHLLIMLGEIDKAKDIYTRLLAITPANKWKELAVLHNQLGTINIRNGDYETALSFFQKTYGIEEKFLPSNHLDLAVTYNNIAETYHSMIYYSMALSFHKKTLEIRQKCLLPNDPLLAVTHNNIAAVYLSMGTYQAARLSYQKALEIGEKCFASKHPKLATIFENLAVVHALMCEYSEALYFYQKSHEIDQKALPPNHMLLLTTHINIASAHDLMGNYSAALSMYEKILEVQQKSLHPNHPTLAVINNNIGLAYLETGKYSKALSCFHKALEIQEKTTYNNPDLVTTYNNIGQLYRIKGNFTETLSYYEKALEIEENYLPSDHPNLATTYNNLGGVYLEMKDHSNAFSFFQKALKIREKCLPPNHQSLATSYDNIGICYQEMKNYPTAILFHQKALEIYENSSTPNDPKLAITYNNMGKTYYLMKDYSTALSFFQQTLQIEEKSLGSNHPDLGYIYHHIAYALEGLQRYQEAFNHIKKAVDIATNACEPDDSRLQIFQDHKDIFLLKVLFILYIYMINEQAL